MPAGTARKSPTGAGYRDQVIRALLAPKWLGALLLSALFAVGAYHLGFWQYGRYEAKHERNQRIEAHYTASPVPVANVLTTAAMPIEREWTRVTAIGMYAAPELLARNRTFRGTNGFEVLTPFATDAGSTLLVDRGWVAPTGKGAASLPTVVTAPGGTVTITGWLRRGEASRGKPPMPGLIPSINLDEASAAVGRPLLGAYLQLDGPAADGDVRPSSQMTQQPTALGPPSEDLGPHQAYAYQWWVSMPLGFVLTFFGLRRQVRAAAGDTAESARDGHRRPVKARKVRIWDEEDE